MLEISNEFLTRLLLFMLVFAITFIVLKKTFKNKSISGAISLIISLIVSFYIKYDQLEFLGTTYGLIGILAILLFPFTICFYFIYLSNLNSLLRKAFWIFYTIVTTLILQNNFSYSEYLNLITTIVVLIGIAIILLDNIIKNHINSIKNLKWWN